MINNKKGEEKMLKNFTQSEVNKMLKLVKLCEKQAFFTFDDLLIKGERVAVIKNYVSQNPSKKFRTWLIDNNYAVKVR